MSTYETFVYVVSLDTLIEEYMKGLEPSDPKLKIVAKTPYMDVQKGKLVVVQATSAPSRSTTSAHPRVLVAFASGPSSLT